MIRTPTVFVLGAGASKPYGFPLGRELIEEVVRSLGPESDPRVRQLMNLGHSLKAIWDFREALRHSGQPSVDAFLERRLEFLEVGKAAMSQVLIGCENPEVLFSKVNDGRKWYMYLWHAMGASLEAFAENAVSFLTFNYDRSLEEYFSTVLHNSSGEPWAKCIEVLVAIPIVHLHGTLGGKPWDGRPYKPDEDTGHVMKSSELIRIIHEHDDRHIEEVPEFAQAHDCLRKARRIVFLGFGYAAANLRRLNVQALQEKVISGAERYYRDFYGTAFGITDLEAQRISGMFTIPARISLGTERQDVLSFLRAKVQLA